MIDKVENGSKCLINTILIFVLFIIVIFSMLGEKVAYNNGAGWDGLFYRDVGYSFISEILSHGYDSYRIQRILPFAIVNIVYSIFGIVKSDSSLMAAIQILNFIALSIGVLYFIKIANLMKLSIPVTIIGFSALFLNYPILKLMGYYPFLTDTYALVMAIMQFYFFITKKRGPLVIVSVIGAFTWPTLFLCGLILAFFPDQKIDIRQETPKVDQLIVGFVKAFMIVGLPFLFTLFYTFKKSLLMQSYSGTVFKNQITLCISLFCVCMYVYGIIRPIRISVIKTFKIFISEFKIAYVLLFVLIYLLVIIIIKYLSNGETFVSVVTMLIARIILPPTVDPFVFIVCNFMYFGFIIFLMLFYWNALVTLYASYGYSFFIIISFGLVMSLNTESRHLLSFIPFLIFPLLQYLTKLNNKRINIQFAFFFALLSLVLSRFWYRINVPGIEQAFIDPIKYKVGNYQDFPAQRLFMSLGPWMSHTMYYLFSVVFIASFLLFAFYFHEKEAKK